MGKKSLIQSTSKKKKSANNETLEKKQVVKGKSGPKAAPDKKTTQKEKASEKGVEVTALKAMSLKDILFKKFEPMGKNTVLAESVASRKSANYASPSFFTKETPEEIEKIKTIQFRKFSMVDLIAAAEKAAAEKAAAEKAAAEKAAAEKAAAEKAAAEKAAAEKAAAEKAAAEKAAAPKKQVPLPAPQKKPDPQEKVMKLSLGAFALIILYLVMVSYSNMNTFHLKAKGNAIELWQGKFSPNGENLVKAFPGAQLPAGLKHTGSKEEIFPFVVGYYLNQADAQYKVPGIPDFKSIESSLVLAKEYAVTPELEQEVLSRLTAIDFTVLLNKAESAIQSGTPENLEAAMMYLADAKKLHLDDAQSKLITDKMSDVRSRIANLHPEKETSPQEPETESKKLSH
jgi:hypothetical protein